MSNFSRVTDNPRGEQVSVFKKCFAGLIFCALLTGCNTITSTVNADDAIRRVEGCTCYLSLEGQKLKPWELSWGNPEKLRQQFSHCSCTADIDLKLVKNPEAYAIPGTIVK